MDRERSKTVDYAVYLLVRVIVCVLQALSVAASLRLAEGLAWLAYRVNRRHRRVADDNLRHAFPELTDAARDRLVRDVYRHFPHAADDGPPAALLPRHQLAALSRHHAGGAADRSAGVRPAGAAGDGPLRQLGAGRLHARRIRVPQPRHLPPARQPLSGSLFAPVPPANGSGVTRQARRLRADGGNPRRPAA
ncbi:MAG: hypothetical protein U0736_17455 [Gemmataceae bacterium]